MKPRVKNYSNAVMYWLRHNGFEPSGVSASEWADTYIVFQAHFFDGDRHRTDDDRRFVEWLADNPRLHADTDDDFHKIVAKNLFGAIGAPYPEGVCAIPECDGDAAVYVADKEPWLIEQQCHQHATTDRDRIGTSVGDVTDAGFCPACHDASLQQHVRNEIVEYDCPECGFTSPVARSPRQQKT